MIDAQREKEFLFDLELLYHRFNIVIDSHCYWLKDVDCDRPDATTKHIEQNIDDLRGTGRMSILTPTPIDMYNFIVSKELLRDWEIVNGLRDEFIVPYSWDDTYLYEIIEAIRERRPSVVRMGPVPVTNWRMQG
jgi:hypothetical protein